jgi:hypothetical protein
LGLLSDRFFQLTLFGLSKGCLSCLSVSSSKNSGNDSSTGWHGSRGKTIDGVLLVTRFRRSDFKFFRSFARILLEFSCCMVVFRWDFSGRLLAFERPEW